MKSNTAHTYWRTHTHFRVHQTGVNQAKQGLTSSFLQDCTDDLSYNYNFKFVTPRATTSSRVKVSDSSP